MVNVRFSNFDDFFKFLKNSTPEVQRILVKAYPDYTKELVARYRYTSDQPKLTTTKVNPKSISGETQKSIGTTANTSNKSGKLGNVLNKTKGFGKAVGKLAVPLAIAGEVPNLISKDTPIQNKILSGIGIAGLLAGNAPIAAAGFLGSGLSRYGQETINKIADENYRKFEERYGDLKTPNAYTQAPQLKPLTQEQQDRVFDYQRGQVNKLLNEYDNSINLLNQEQIATNEAAARLQRVQENLKNQQELYADLLGGNVNLQSNRTQPQSNLLSSTPVDIQNSQQASLNNKTKQDIAKYNRQALMELPVASNLANQYRVGANTNFQGLQDMVNNNNNNNNNNINPQTRSGALNYYAQMLGLQNAQAQVAAQEMDDTYRQLINDFQNAQRLDAIQNQTNQIQNVMNRMSYERPVQFIDHRGNLQSVGGYNPPYRDLPIETNTNANNYLRLMNLEQARRRAVQGNQPNMAEDLGKIMGAEAVARTIGVDPIALINYGDKIIPYQQAINTAKTTAEERRKDIPYNTLSNIIENQNKIAGEMDLANLRANLGMIQEQYTQNELNKRAYAQLVQDSVLAQKRIDSELALLRERGVQEKDLARYKLQLENEDPSLRALKGMQYSANYPDPNQAIATYQQFLNIFRNGNQPGQATDTPVAGGRITPIGYERMMRR